MGFARNIVRKRGAGLAAKDGGRPRRAMVVVAGACALAGLLAWTFYLAACRAAPGQDWMVFYTAAREYLDGHLPIVFDGARLTAALNTRFADWLVQPLNLHPWVYPPVFLLLFLPFGVLPPALSIVLFLATGFVAVVAAATCLGHRGDRWMMMGSLVLCPAVPLNIMTGQNAFFTAALLAGGVALLERAPLVSGFLLGTLTFKPQLWLMVPVALAAARQWRVLFVTLAVAAALSALSVAVFGIGAWRAWIELMNGGNPQFGAWVAAGRINGVSVFACVHALGATDGFANLAQVAAVGIAAGFVYWLYRRPAPGPLHLSGLLAATMLAAPHASDSDAVLLALAVPVFIAGDAARQLRAASYAIAAAVWICPLFNPPSVFRVGVATPLLLILFMVCVASAIGENVGRRSARLTSAARSFAASPPAA